MAGGMYSGLFNNATTRPKIIQIPTTACLSAALPGLSARQNMGNHSKVVKFVQPVVKIMKNVCKGCKAPSKTWTVFSTF